MSLLLYAAIVVFLIVFIVLAWVLVEDLRRKHEDKRLDGSIRHTLIGIVAVDAVGCVILFVTLGVKSAYAEGAIEISEGLLARSRGWDWQYTDQNWRTTINFIVDDGALGFSANTFYTRDGEDKEALVAWKSTEPIQLAEGDSKLQFDAEMTVTEAAIRRNPTDWFNSGTFGVTITLESAAAMSGSWIATDSTYPTLRGGMMLTPVTE